MASIYDKALKRKDFSGIVDKDAAAKKDPKAISASLRDVDPSLQLTLFNRLGK